MPGLSDMVHEDQIALMRRMTDHIQRDVELAIFSGSRGHIFTCDSSTNMSSVFARLST